MKVFGIGIDIVRVDRMIPWMKKKSLLNKIFTKKELHYVFSNNNSVFSLAGFFAAKESVLKTLKKNDVNFLNEIEICHDKYGAPYINFYGETKKNIFKKNFIFWKLTIAHEKKYAIAFVIGGQV